MSTYDQYNDTPYQIVNEGEQISLKLKRLSSTTAEISWNIPKNGDGTCGSDSVYNGILITLDDTSTTPEKFPIDGQQYVADPTGDRNLHVGDKIDTALVVGFFVDDKTTTKLVVTDLDPTKAYYISGHALSSVFSYHNAGVHSYSTPYGNVAAKDTAAYQNIQVGPVNVGVELVYQTGLKTDQVYSLDMILDNDVHHTFTFNGPDVLTYQDFINNWNYQAMLLNNPLQSPVIPNINGYYFNNSTQQLFQWNGTQNVLLPVYIDETQPNIVLLNDVWVKPSTQTLYQATSIGPVVWTPRPFITFNHDPASVQCDDLWFNGTDLFKWSGSAWLDNPYFLQNIDPSLPPSLSCSAHWFNEESSELFVYDEDCGCWKSTLAQLSDTDPSNPTVGHLWFNDSVNKLYEFDGLVYVEIPVAISTTQPNTVPIGQHWYNPSTMQLSEYTLTGFISSIFLLWHFNPTAQVSGSLWWNSTNDTLWQWDGYTNSWKSVTPFFIQTIDPSLPPVLDIGTVWTLDNVTYKQWDGSEWVVVNVINYLNQPQTIVDGVYWYNTVDKKYYVRQTGAWVLLSPIIMEDDPAVPSIGDYWYDSVNNLLYQFNGSLYVNLPYSPTSLKPTLGYTYFNTVLGNLQTWNGTSWVVGNPMFTVSLSDNKQFIHLQTSKLGSSARVEVGYDLYDPIIGAVNTKFPLHMPTPEMFMVMNPPAIPKQPRTGGDGLQAVPSYAQLGVGTDGTTDERRELIDSIRSQLGYPAVEVELNKQQMNVAIDKAIETLRQRSSMPYVRGFQFLDIEPHVQHYGLTDKKIGYNKIVEVIDIHRVTSAFLSNAGGQGLYGQMAVQQMYQMGSFDLISYHMVAQYISTMQTLFASKVAFNWNEDNRTLSIYKDFYKRERVLMEVCVERTEQNMLKDRYLKTWIESFALCQAKYMLAAIRGKFASGLPGAGGGLTLNANELTASADVMMLDLYDQIDKYVVNDMENYAGAAFILG
jgi:hypothetical protein